MKILFYLLTAVIILSLSFLRLFIGVDFTDEAFYASFPYSFSLGIMPFSQDWAPQQLSGIIPWPAVKVFLEFFKNSDGLIFFLRLNYFFLALLCGFIVWSYLKKERYLPLALIPVVFCPFTLPTISYNTMAALFLCCGFFMKLQSERLSRVFQTLFFILTIISYPPFIAAIGLYYIFKTILSKPRTHQLKVSAVSILAISVAIACCLMSFGIENVITTFSNSAKMSVHGGGIRKALGIVFDLLSLASSNSVAKIIGLISVIATCYAIIEQRTKILAVVCILIAVAYLRSTSLIFIASVTFIFLPFIILNLWKSHNLKSLDIETTSIYFSSLAAGFVAAVTSANGAYNAGLGMLPAFIISLKIITDMAFQIDTKWWKPSAILFLFCFVFQFFQFQNIYSESKVWTLTKRVDFGPYEGLFTSPQKYDYLKKISTDIHSAIQQNPQAQSILFFDHFPAGYLLSPLLPMTKAMWTPPVDYVFKIDRNFFASHFNEEKRPDIVVRVKGGPFIDEKMSMFPTDQADPLASKILGFNYVAFIKSESHDIYVK